MIFDKVMRRGGAACVLGLASVLAGACSSGGDSSTEIPTSTATSRPMSPESTTSPTTAVVPSGLEDLADFDVCTLVDPAELGIELGAGATARPLTGTCYYSGPETAVSVMVGLPRFFAEAQSESAVVVDGPAELNVVIADTALFRLYALDAELGVRIDWPGRPTGEALRRAALLAALVLERAHEHG